MVVAAVLFPGFWSRIAVFLALIFGYLLSWLFDAIFGQITSALGRATPRPTDHDRVTWAGRGGGRLDRASRAARSPTVSPSCTGRASR